MHLFNLGKIHKIWRKKLKIWQKIINYFVILNPVRRPVRARTSGLKNPDPVRSGPVRLIASGLQHYLQ